MNCVNKLVLGTVQFGLDYGINNQFGQVHQDEVGQILRWAKKSGINTFDTSSAYGSSESVLGRSLSENNLQFQIISKYPQSKENVATVFASSIEKLHQQKLYGYLVHHFEFYQSHPQLWEEMKQLKAEGKVEKIGFSLYDINQLQYLLDNRVEFDILQFPYNLFDRQFDVYLPQLKQSGVEIHTRSVFLQGLFFKDLGSLSGQMEPLKPYLLQIRFYCAVHSITIEQCALSFVLRNPFIDGVLIGVDNISQLQNNINVAICTKEVEELAKQITVKETYLLNPSNWL